MKYLMFVFMLTGSLASFSADSDSETYFLNSKEFKSMPQEQQAKYLKSLQKIIAIMAKQTLYMASSESQGGSRSPASAGGKSVDELLEASYADVNGEGFKFRENNKVKIGVVSESDLISNPLPLPLPPLASSTETQIIAEKVRKERQEILEKYNIRYADVNGNPDRQPLKYRTNNEATAAAAATTTITTPASASAAPATPASAATADTATAVLEKPKAAASATEEKPIAAKNDKKPVRASDKKPASKDTDVITETKDGKLVSGNEVVKESTAAKKSERGQFRCMYSGWVVEKDPCQAQQAFPDNYSIKGVDKAKMVCGAKETVCNPTLFGLRLPKDCKKLNDCATDAVPLCVRKGAWPTEDCYNLSTYQDTLVAAEIASSDSAQYDRFTQNFADLCDKDQIKTNPFAEPNNRANRRVSPEGVRRDIEITCSWAKKKMKDTTEAYRIASVVNGGKAPASSDKAAKPSTEKPNGQK